MNTHGDFLWYELMTTAPDAAQAFYASILGWTWKSSGHPGMDYRLFSAGDVEVGGMMTLSTDMMNGSAQPMWAGYIGVDDVDTCAAAITRAGGTVLMNPQDIPDVGRIAFVSDPEGVPFYIMRGSSDAASLSFARYEPKVGHCAWNELSAKDPDAARAFYGARFGWVKDGEMDMGPMGSYEFLKSGGDRPYMLGAVMRKPDAMPVPAWTHYFRVADIDAAATAITRSGGSVIQDPTEIPGGDFSLVGMDPQGAGFGLVGPGKAAG